MNDAPEILTESAPGWLPHGKLIKAVPTPEEATALAFPWKVEQLSLIADDKDGKIRGPGPALAAVAESQGLDVRRYNVPGWVANVRSDTGDTLGVVKEGFRPVQNLELMKLVYAIAEDSGQVEIETAGTFKGGRVVYILARAKTLIRVGDTGKDVSVPYLSFLNGHDGGMSLQIQPTAFRICCLNAHRMMLGEDVVHFSFRHSAGIIERVQQARMAIQAALQGIDLYAQQAADMARTPLLQGDAMDFYRDIYAGKWGLIPFDPKTDEEKRRNRRAGRIISEWVALSNSPRQTFDGIGGTVWSALQSVTEWADHVKTVRGNGDARSYGNLFGDSHKLKASAHKMALALV